MQRIATGTSVIDSDYPARLYWIGGHPVNDKALFDDMGRARKGRSHLSVVARLIEIGLVVRAIAVELRGACLKCVARRYNSEARRVLDRDAFGRITCYVDGIGDDNRNRVADVH